MRRGGKELSKRVKNRTLIDVRMYPKQFSTLFLHSKGELVQHILNNDKVSINFNVNDLLELIF